MHAEITYPGKDITGEKRRILIVSSSFYPLNSPRSFRTTELVKEFARMGHDVTLLTLKKEEIHREFENAFGVKIKDLGPLRLPSVNMTGKNRLTRLPKIIAGRGLQLLFEYPDIELMYRVKKALRTECGYALMISIAVPHTIHWGVAWARSKKNRVAETWVADCGDPYMGFDIDRVSKPFYFKYLEKMFCRSADFISVPIEGAKEAYYEEFRHKIEVIPQGFKFEESVIDGQAAPADGFPVFGYAGNLLGGGRNPHELLEYLVNLDREFKFVIYTKKKDAVIPYLEKARGRIVLRDYIPRKQLLRELSTMDFLVNLENNTASQLPSKLIDYYFTGRPVLSVPSKELNTSVVSQFLDGNYTGQFQFNDMDQYKIEHVCRRFLDLCIGKVSYV